jgi:hypothetical protein
VDPDQIVDGLKIDLIATRWRLRKISLLEKIDAFSTESEALSS